MFIKMQTIKENESESNDADLDIKSIINEFRTGVNFKSENMDKYRKLMVDQHLIKCRLVFIARTYYNNGLVIKINPNGTYDIDVIYMGKSTKFKNNTLDNSKGFVNRFMNSHCGYIKSSWCIL
jgi:hypothetical protein